MLQDLKIVHRRKPALFTQDHGSLVWATCLRSLAFGGTPEAGDEYYMQEDAYRFLLEVVCGLKSPIVGETEVFGQFKSFSQEWIKREPKRATLVQKLLSDAKAIRSEHLRGLGVQSYGSWVRGKLAHKRVHFLGCGQMVREIYPYVAKQEREITVHARAPQRAEGFASPVLALSEQGFDEGALIIAAPMTAKEIAAWLDGRGPAQIIDLRDTSATDPVRAIGKTQIYLLADIFGEIEKTKASLAPRLESVNAEILERAKKAASQSLLRPQGWDDLCA